MSGQDRPAPPGDGGAGGGPDDGRTGRIAVVGPGRVGQSLAAALSDAGRPVTLFGRRRGRPDFLDAFPDVRYRAAGPRQGGDRASGAFPTVVFCVPDDALARVAAAWAGAGASGGAGGPAGRDASGGGEGSAPPGADVDAAEGVALHTSGVHGAEVLAPVREAGRAVAAWHPLTALSGPRADAFRGVPFTVQGDEPAARRARRLAEAVGGRSMGMEPGGEARYHAAAVFASNHLVACLSVAARELEAATGGEGSLDDLLPLARAAVENLSGGGLAEGATGPLARGDVGTVRRHLRALPPESAALYRRLARELLDVVEGRLQEDAAEELRRMLDEETGDGA